MTYSYKLKLDLFDKKVKPCCCSAELYGFLLFSRKFSEESIKVKCEHPDILDHYSQITESIFKQDLKIEEKGQIYCINETEGLSKKIFSRYSKKGCVINTDILKKQCCFSAFLRGAFVSSGFISDPQKDYHLEMTVFDRVLADEFIKLCENVGISFKITVRRDHFVVYAKSSETIKDFLAEMGATEQVFDYSNAEIYKDMRNSVNRIVNCESANIDKSVIAAANQIGSIRKLEKNGFDKLTQELKQISLIRMENPELSLTQLGQICEPPISKSGICRKLKKICAIAEETD